MSKLRNAIGWMDKGLQRLLMGLMAILLLDVCWQVLTRFVLSQPSSFTEELARFLLMWIGLLGGAHAYRHKMHLGVDVLTNALSPSWQHHLLRIVHALTLAFAISVLVYGGVKLCLLAFHLGQQSASMQINMGMVYLALPISGALFALFAAEHILVSFSTTPKQQGN